MTGELFTDAARYDRVCAYCLDGRPAGRLRGKVVCATCATAFIDPIEPTGELYIPPERLRRLIRHLLGMGPRSYIEPLWIRAMRRRKQ